MISEDYKNELKEMHATQDSWGTTGGRRAGALIAAALTRRVDDRACRVLDFGCGKGTLGDYLDEDEYLSWHLRLDEYDPGIPGLDVLPDELYDVILSSDVLEHVEPEFLDETLEWFGEHAECLMMYVACSPDGHKLRDGRDRHLSVHPPGWWEALFLQHGWVVMESHDIIYRQRGQSKRAAFFWLERRL